MFIVLLFDKMGREDPQNNPNRDRQSDNDRRQQPNAGQQQQPQRPNTLQIPRAAANEVFNTFRIPNTNRNNQQGGNRNN